MAQPSIDVHTHFLPEAAVRAAETGGDWFGIGISRNADGVPVAEEAGRTFVFGSDQHFEPRAERVRRMDARQVGTEMLSILPPLFRYSAPLREAIAAGRDTNDELSDLSVRFPGRFLGLATLPMQDVTAAVEEATRSLALPGIVGVSIGTHVAGTDLDDESLAPLFSALEDMEAFVFVHPMHPRAATCLGGFYLSNIIGNPLETTIAASRLMLSGRLASVPRLRICLAHAGGYLPAATGRLRHGHQVRTETSASTDVSPQESYRRFAYDSLTHDAATLRHLVDFVGLENVVLGTDFPADMGQTDAVADICAMTDLDEAEKLAILGGNLRREPRIAKALAAQPISS
jgi:aminocarboxymuconate-semialdehyde decarboxylase